VRVVLTDHVTDDARGLLVGLVPVVVELVHGEQHAAVHGLQAVADIGQRAADDHAHGVIEIALLELVLDGDGGNFSGQFSPWSALFRVIRQAPAAPRCTAVKPAVYRR
jgi:hypothetical protein